MPKLHWHALLQAGRQAGSALLTCLLAHGAVSHGLLVKASRACRAVLLLWILRRCRWPQLLCKVIELKPVNHFGAAWLLLCAWCSGLGWPGAHAGALGLLFLESNFSSQLPQSDLGHQV